MYIALAAGIIFLGLLIFNRDKAMKFLNTFLDHPVLQGFIAFASGVAINMAGFKDSILYEETLNYVVFLIFISPVFIVHSIRKKKKEREQKNMPVEQQISMSLPKKPKEREKLIQKFSEKYGLNLTSKEITKIVNASYHSQPWENEVYAMMQDYENINEWYHCETNWLRVFLKVFNVQTVSSDFAYQKDICINAFDEVFQGVEMEHYVDNDECIRAMNNKFLTNFDESTFMIAYRFLEANGRHFTLPTGHVLSMDGVAGLDSELAQLEQKYKTMQTP